MKKIFLVLILFSFVSCDYILKNNPSSNSEVVIIDSLRKNQILEDTDEHGCDLKGDYRWSNLKKECVRVFEECYRLTSIEKDSTGKFRNAYFTIDEDSLKAEIYLPNSKESFVLNRENEDVPFTYGGFELKTKNRFALFYNRKMLFKSAIAEDVKIIESDTEKMKGEPENQEKDTLE